MVLKSHDMHNVQKLTSDPETHFMTTFVEEFTKHWFTGRPKLRLFK